MNRVFPGGADHSLILFFLEFVLVFVQHLVVVVALFFVVVVFVFVEVVVIVKIVVFVVGDIELVGTRHNEVLATLRTAQDVSFLVVCGVNFVVFALWTGRHTG